MNWNVNAIAMKQKTKPTTSKIRMNLFYNDICELQNQSQKQ